jgi:tetratricopeptide (TPR) repeat protein
LKEYSSAIRRFETALKIMPCSLGALVNLGTSYVVKTKYMWLAKGIYLRHDLDTGINILEKAVRLSAHFKAYNQLGSAYHLKAFCLMQRGINPEKEFELARKAHEEAIKIRPDLFILHYNLGILFKSQAEYLCASGRGDPLKLFSLALKSLQDAIDLDPRVCMLYIEKARTHYLKGRYLSMIRVDGQQEYLKALELYNKAERLDKMNRVKFYCYRADVYYELKRYQDAISDWEKVIRLNPSYERRLRARIVEAKRRLKQDYR